MTSRKSALRSEGFCPDPELAGLVAACIDSGLTAADLTRLEKRLAADSDARRYYLDSMLLDGALHDHFARDGVTGMVDLLAPGGGAAEPAEEPFRRDHVRPLTRAAAAILLVMVVGGGVGGLANWQGVRAAVSNWSAHPLAEISRTRLAVAPRNIDQATLKKGRKLGRERVALESGAVEITLRNGVMIVLEGPAEIELAGEEQAFLHRGVAVVRGAAGSGDFDLDTPTAHVANRGGEFAAKINPSHDTDVQVYSGEVVATGIAKLGSGQFPLQIVAGEAMRFSAQPDASPEQIVFSNERFTRRVPDEKGIGLGNPATRDDASKTGQPKLEAIVVTRAVEPVAIDGCLDDWNEEGEFRAMLPGGREWVEGRMMYDDERLYVAARVGDPLPLRNSIDHNLDPSLVWQGGGLQLFFSADRAVGWPADANGPNYYEGRKIEAPFAEQLKAENPRLMTLIMTHHAPSRSDRLFIGRTVVDYAMQPIASGDYQGRFVASPDGKGYTLEYAIPWTTLGIDDDPPRPGDRLATAWELHFSEETGKLWRNQIIEIRNRNEPRDIFLYERAATWGRAEFR